MVNWWTARSEHKLTLSYRFSEHTRACCHLWVPFNCCEPICYADRLAILSRTHSLQCLNYLHHGSRPFKWISTAIHITVESRPKKNGGSWRYTTISNHYWVLTKVSTSFHLLFSCGKTGFRIVAVAESKNHSDLKRTAEELCWLTKQVRAIINHFHPAEPTVSASLLPQPNFRSAPSYNGTPLTTNVSPYNHFSHWPQIWFPF